MRNKEQVKEAIITAATELIEQSDGDINAITARAIAEKSGVALGLINYHFENKVLMGFSPNKTDYGADDGLTDKERLISFAQQTFDFLYDNYSIVKISILSDLKDYQPRSNSALT